MPEHKVSARAKRVWQRFMEWYGARFADQYGEIPSADWCQAIDEATNDEVKLALSKSRMQYLQYPPTLPQFEQLLKPARVLTGPSMADRLCHFAMRQLGASLTPTQIREPWTYLGSPNEGITGVVIPADGDAPSHRVMVADMHAEAA